MTPTFRALRFSTDHCAICKAQKRTLLVERFCDGPPKVQLLEQVCAAEDAELKDPSKKAAYDLSEEYGVTMYPTLVVEAQLTGGASVELCRAEGGVTLKQLTKMFEEAREQLVSEHLKWSDS